MGLGTFVALKPVDGDHEMVGTVNASDVSNSAEIDSHEEDKSVFAPSDGDNPLLFIIIVPFDVKEYTLPSHESSN